MSVYLLAILVVLGLTAEHYFPHWADWTGHKLPSPVRLIVNYAAGSAVWFGAFWLWLILNGYGNLAAIGLGFALLGGLTVVSLYLLDAYINNKKNLADSLEVNSLLERQKRDAEQRS